MLGEVLDGRDLEVILFFSPENLRYLSGFCGGEGVLLVLKDKRRLLVDFRYLEEAHQEASGCEVSLLERGMKGLAAVLKEMGLKRVGLEAGGLSLAAYEELKREVEGVELVPLREELEPLRAVKTGEEVARIRRAVQIAERALEEVLGMVKPGVTEKDLALELEFRMRRLGSDGVAFEPIVASGPRSALPHARPSSKALREGEAVIVDFGARWEGYCSDETVTLFLGEAPPELEEAYGVVREAQEEAIEAIRPGVPCKEVDERARAVIRRAGYDRHFGHGTGHGVGLAVHEPPTLYQEAKGELREGMVVTVEPGIYLPGVGGVRLEDLVLVTQGGCQLLTRIDKGVKVL